MDSTSVLGRQALTVRRCSLCLGSQSGVMPGRILKSVQSAPPLSPTFTKFLPSCSGKNLPGVLGCLRSYDLAIVGRKSIKSRKGGGGKSGGLPTGFFWVSKNLGDAGHRFLA